MSRVPLLLLPGLLCDDRLWRDQAEALADLAEPIVADLTQDDSVDAMAERALAAAPDRFALAGLSMGGYVAFAIMRRAPERVIRLCLLDTSARQDTPEQRRRRKGLIALSKTGRFKGVTPRLLPQLVHPDRLTDAVLAEEVMAMADRIGKEAFLRQQTAILNRPDSRPFLSRIGVRTVVGVGEADALSPPERAQEIAAGIAGADLHLIPEAGHLPPMERPDAVNALMRAWLTDSAVPI